MDIIFIAKVLWESALDAPKVAFPVIAFFVTVFSLAIYHGLKELVSGTR